MWWCQIQTNGSLSDEEFQGNGFFTALLHTSHSSDCIRVAIPICMPHKNPLRCFLFPLTRPQQRILCVMEFIWSRWSRFTSTQRGKPIDMANCPSPRSCKKVRGVRAAFPARGWSCSLCYASRPVTTWPSSSTAPQIPPGSSSTVWLTATVGFRKNYLYRISSNYKPVELDLWENICPYSVVVLLFLKSL